MEQIDRVLANVAFLVQRGRDVDCGVGHDQGLGVAGHIHGIDMADAARRAKLRRSHHRCQQLIGVQTALHECANLACHTPLHGALCCRVAVFHRLDLNALKAQLSLLGGSANFVFGADQHRIEQPL